MGLENISLEFLSNFNIEKILAFWKNFNKLNKYFPKNYSNPQIEKKVQKLIGPYVFLYIPSQILNSMFFEKPLLSKNDGELETQVIFLLICISISFQKNWNLEFIQTQNNFFKILTKKNFKFQEILTKKSGNNIINFLQFGFRIPNLYKIACAIDHDWLC